MNKQAERYYADKAAEFLGKTWSLGPDRESPDFLVTEGTRKFGLEISEVFTGPQSRAGSKIKEKESRTQKKITALQSEYENITNIPLQVRLVGDMSAENMAKVVPALVAEDFKSKPICHQKKMGVDDGFSIFATKALRPNWYGVNDRVGWVNRNPTPHIADTIKKKSRKLPEYKKAAGQDIRLLLVANCRFNSGKLRLREGEGAEIDLQGFRAVYFLSYPESIKVLCNSDKE